MKVTRRQLRRIIREEYTRLKRRGVIRENLAETGSIIVDYYPEEIGASRDPEEQRQILKDLASGPGWTVEVLTLRGPANGMPVLQLSGDKEAIRNWYDEEIAFGMPDLMEVFDEQWVSGPRHPDRDRY